jgi:hypothetical protein
MSSDERRLTDRVIAKWQALLLNSRFPRRVQLAPDSFGGDWSSCMLLRLEDAVLRSRLIYVGEELRKASGTTTQERVALSDYPDGCLLRLANAKISAVFAKAGPITFGGTGMSNDTAILYRAVLLPLSDDGRHIDHVLGAVNYREISVEKEATEAEAMLTLKAGTGRIASNTFASPPASFVPNKPTKPMLITIR